MTPPLSPLQNRIISKLKNAKSLKYSEMQIKGVPNDLYNYHLQFLVKKGLLEKITDGYKLSPQGVKLVADYNPPTDESGATHLFKVNVLTVVSRIHNKKLQILSQVRKSNPSFGKIGVMGGVVKKGESFEDAATRKLKVETGLDANFKILGIQRRTMYVKNELFSDVLFPIAYTDECDGELVVDSEYGHNMWVPIDEAIKNESLEFDSIKKLPEIFQAVKAGKVLKLPFFYEEDIQSGDKM